MRTGSREIELGRSMRVWLGSKMGLSIGGMTYKNVSEQARRMLTELGFNFRGAGGQSIPIFSSFACDADRRRRSLTIRGKERSQEVAIPQMRTKPNGSPTPLRSGEPARATQAERLRCQ